MEPIIDETKYFYKKDEILNFIYQNKEKYNSKILRILEDTILLDDS